MLFPSLARAGCALALVASLPAALAAPLRPAVRAPPGAALLYPPAQRDTPTEEYAAPLVGGIAAKDGYVVRRDESPQEYAAPLVGGIAAKDGYVVRSPEGGALVGGDHPAVGFVARQIVDTKIFNESNFPPADKTVNLSVTREWFAPDGFGRIHYLINGQYPGPLLLWDEDDWVKVQVTNNCSNPFTIHWHGIWQVGTPHMDGVPGVNQWNIPVGETYVYYFQLREQHGAYWAHAHTQGYYSDGLRLPIYVRPKPGTPKPWSLISNKSEDIEAMEAAEQHFGLNWRTDQWHVTAEDMELNVHATGVPPACMDSLLTNGRGRQFCFNNWTEVANPIEIGLYNANKDINQGWSSKGCVSLVKAKDGFDTIHVFDEYYGGKCQNTTAPITVYNVGKALKAGRKYFNLQVIEATTNWFDGFSVDNHNVWLVAVDGSYVVPKRVDFAQITIGSRLSFMIELDPAKAHRDWPIRFTGVRALQPIEGYSLLSYNESAGDTIDLTIDEGFHYLTDRTNASVSFGGQIKASAIQWRQADDEPYKSKWTVPKKADVTLHAFAAQNSLNVWQVAEQPLDSVKADSIQPVMYQLVKNGGDISKINTTMLPLSPHIPMGATVDIVIHNPALSIVGKSNSPHPFHLHGHKFWIIKSASGPFTYDTVADAQKAGLNFSLTNPPFRDGYDVSNDGYAIIRFIAGVGPNLLHCHIDDHLVQGMAAVLLEGLDQIPKGTFASNYSEKPNNWRDTEEEPVPVELEKSWQTGLDSGLILPTVNPSDPWGDPRSQGLSAQSLASKVSVQLNHSAISVLSVASTAKSSPIPPSYTYINKITARALPTATAGKS